MSWTSYRFNLFRPSQLSEWQAHMDCLGRMYGGTICRVPDAATRSTPASEAISAGKFHGYTDVDTLIDHDEVVGTGQCVALIQAYVKDIGPAKTWKPGPPVSSLSAKDIPKGTVIATFWNCVYPNRKTGNHAAFYLSHNAKGIKVVEQWSGATVKQAKAIRSADGIRFKGTIIPADQSGDPPNMTNDAAYYHVVLTNR